MITSIVKVALAGCNYMMVRDILNSCSSSPFVWGWTGSIGRGNICPHVCGGVFLRITLAYKSSISTITRVFFELAHDSKHVACNFSCHLSLLPATKKLTLQPKPRFIKYCTTKQAAILLDVSISTLYRSRRAGRPYEKNGCIAKSTAPNRWQVIL